MSAYLSAVNRKRLYAGLLLELGEKDEQRHRQQALLQGAVMHLRCAFDFYLMEMADTYQCPEPDAIPDVETLVEALSALDKTPAESREIQHLATTPGSWLYRLLDCHAALVRVGEVPAVHGEAEEELIPAVSTARREDWSLLASGDVAAWVGAFNEMVERQRQFMVEC